MALPPASPLAFGAAWLRACRAALEARPLQPLHLVVGNEAADADSVVAALAYAFRLAALPRRSPPLPPLPPLPPHASAPPAPAPARTHVPVVSCRRRDWPLRREAADMLARCLAAGDGGGASEGAAAAGAASNAAASAAAGGDDGLASLLIFLDDVEAVAPLLAADAPRLLAVTLVDHNELRVGGAGGCFLGAALAPHAAACVVEIVDHHLDAGRHAHVAGAARLIAFDRAAMAGVGSTCTLVAQRLLDDDDDEVAAAAAAAGGVGGAAGAGAARALDPRLAEMLLSTIALDTAGLDEAAGKTTPLDALTLRRLRAVVDAGAPAPASAAAGAAAAAALEPRAVFARLMALKQEPAFWRGLSVAQALGFDFKAFALPAAAAGSAGDAGDAGAGVEGGDGAEFGTASVMARLDDFLGGWEEEGAAAAAGNERGAAAAAGAAARRAEGRLREVAAFAGERGLAFVVVMSAVSAAGGGGGLDRGLALVAPAGSHGARLVDEAARLLLLRAPELLLEETSAAGSAEAIAAAAGVRVRTFRQGNGKASRKQLVPLLLAALGEVQGAGGGRKRN